MKASSSDDRDDLLLFAARRPPLESDADFDKSNGDKKIRQNGSLECLTDLGGWGVRGFLSFGGGGSSMSGFCGDRGLV